MQDAQKMQDAQVTKSLLTACELPCLCMGLIQTTKAQTSLHISAVCQNHCFSTTGLINSTMHEQSLSSSMHLDIKLENIASGMIEI